MRSLAVQRYINSLLQGENEARLTTDSLSRTFGDNGVAVHVFRSHEACFRILNDQSFLQPRIADAVAEIARRFDGNVSLIEFLLRGNPIQMDPPHHRAKRLSFLRFYNERLKACSQLFRPAAELAINDFKFTAARGITRGLVTPYIDRITELLLTERPGKPLRRGSWGSSSDCIFQYFHSPWQLKKKAQHIEELLDELGFSAATLENQKNERAFHFLSLILQGRDPLIGGLAGFAQSLLPLGQRERTRTVDNACAKDLFECTSPVNYVGRVATKSMRLDGLAIERGDHVVLMLSMANREALLSDRTKVAFGAGPHICAGQALALEVAQAWLDALKNEQHKIHWSTLARERLKPSVFRTYEPP
jgi:cytochrome P450